MTKEFEVLAHALNAYLKAEGAEIGQWYQFSLNVMLGRGAEMEIADISAVPLNNDWTEGPGFPLPA